LGGWLDLMIFEVFSNLDDSMILITEENKFYHLLQLHRIFSPYEDIDDQAPSQV